MKEGFNEPELEQSSEQSLEQIEATRRKYLEALAISMGANEMTARMSVDALLRNKDNLLSSVAYGKDRDDHDPKDAEQIEALGSWLLNGSKKYDSRKFTIGARILSLLKEDPNSGYFTNLEQWVGMWTDGTCDKKFKEMIEEKE